MRHFLAIIGLSLFLMASSFAQAGEPTIVTFPSLPKMPTPFKIKQAKAKGEVAKPIPGVTLTGHLQLPDKKGRNPAVIILLGGDGMNRSYKAWLNELADAGFVGLLIDGFASRGIKDFRDGNVDMSMDAVNGHIYLSKHPAVDPDNIGVMGFSLGARGVYMMMRKDYFARPNYVNFQAGVAIYPHCEQHVSYSGPILVIGGDVDPLVNALECVKLAQDKAEDISYHLYPGGTHFFDNPSYSKDPSLRPENWQKPLWFKTNHYDQNFHKDSIKRLTDFFNTHLR